MQELSGIGRQQEAKSRGPVARLGPRPRRTGRGSRRGWRGGLRRTARWSRTGSRSPRCCLGCPVRRSARPPVEFARLRWRFRSRRACTPPARRGWSPRGGPGRRRPVDDPPVEPVDGGIERPVRSTGVDGNRAAEPTHRSARRVLHGSQVLHCTLTVAGVVGTDGEAVVVVVRAARDLPESEPLRIAVVQPVGQVAVVDVGFGLELEDRNAEVTADRGRGRGRIRWSAVLGRVERRYRIGCARGTLGRRGRSAVPHRCTS